MRGNEHTLPVDVLPGREQKCQKTDWRQLWHYARASMELPSYRHFPAILISKIHTDTTLKERGGLIREFLTITCWNTDGQDVAEYAVMLAVILIIVIGVVRMIGSNANTVFSNVGSAIQ